MNVVVNGEPLDVADAATVADVVEKLGFGQRNVVVERNGEPVERARFSAVKLADNDALEIVRPVPGG